MFSLYFSSEFLFASLYIGRKEEETDYAPDANSRPAVGVGSYAEKSIPSSYSGLDSTGPGPLLEFIFQSISGNCALPFNWVFSNESGIIFPSLRERPFVKPVTFHCRRNL